jgi:hypothetical protein
MDASPFFPDESPPPAGRAGADPPAPGEAGPASPLIIAFPTRSNKPRRGQIEPARALADKAADFKLPV